MSDENINIIMFCDFDEWTGTLAQFLADNKDGIDESEANEIRATLAEGRSYLGGGGAAYEWVLKLKSEHDKQREADLAILNR